MANRGDGRTVEVEWDPSFKLKEWYFYTYRNTVWQLRRDVPYAKQLIEFAFGNKLARLRLVLPRMVGEHRRQTGNNCRNEQG